VNARACNLVLAVSMALALPARAQHAGHAPPAVPASPAPTQSPPASTDAHAAMGHETMDHETMDHETMDHETMDHAAQADGVTPALPRDPIPVPTDADRAAAFPAVHAHHMHGTRPHAYWLLDRLELVDADHGRGMAWEGSAWLGGDVQRLWLRSEGHARAGKLERGDLEVLYGRGVRAWWDVLAGVRHEAGEGPSRTWAAFGVQGMAPYKFEVSATAYLGQAGRSAARLEAEYDTLLSNRWILQWRAEADLQGQADPALRRGAGLSAVEAGLRLRYEVTRQFAPYVGIEHERLFGATADLHRADGEAARDTRVVAGVRVWF
jgi:copper resistance protein B